MPHGGKRWIRKCLKWLTIAWSSKRARGVPQQAKKYPKEKRFPDHYATIPQSNGEAVSPSGEEISPSGEEISPRSEAVLSRDEEASSSGETVPPILRLPPELVVSIAELLLDEEVSGVQYYDPVINISHASSRLRKICIKTPSLWKKVFMEDSDGSFGLATACVARSEDTSLDITTHVINQVQDRSRDILRLLHYTSHRIASLAITLAVHSEASWMELVTKLQNMRMPRLHTLSADVWVGEIIGRVGPQPILLLPKAPNLSSLSLVSLATETGASRLSNIRRLSLTIFTFWAQPYTTLLNMLTSCQHLAELELSRREEERYVTAHDTDLWELPPFLPLPLPELLRLSITGFENPIFLHLLLNTEAPQLEFVQVDTPYGPSFIDFPWKEIAFSQEARLAFPSARVLGIVKGLQDGKQSSLTRLRFGFFLSKVVPNVEEVEILAASSIFLAICRIMDPETGHPFWPNLSRLSILESSHEVCPWQSSQILRMIVLFLQQRRYQGLSRIASVDVEMSLSDLGQGEFGVWLNQMEEVGGLQFFESQPGSRTGDRVVFLRGLPAL
ncbi:hypothetical protein FRC00_002532 [Tulasnella sp. 408]|nr:hypothetical protein FRC00_002532 [Tulasnella sp. 408]